MHYLLWGLQFLMGAFFIGIGVMHFILPPGLPPVMQWMYELPMWLHVVSGAAEILGGLGLILPGLTGIRTELTPLAAVGLLVIMVFAVVFHLQRGEYQNIVTNALDAAVLAFIAYGRWRLRPLSR